METTLPSYQYQLREFNSFSDLVNLVLSSLSSGVSDSERQSRYDLFLRHPYKSILYEIFLEMKHNIGYPERAEQEQTEEENPVFKQLVKLDGMLLAKGIISVSESEYCHETVFYDPPINNPDYFNLVEMLKSIYHSELNKYTQGRESFCGAVLSLLTDQSHVRPISNEEINSFVEKVQKFFLPIETQLKQQICEAALVSCSRSLDARRKRRNFKKESTDILNQYFQSNLENPYPDEEKKAELSKKCGLTVSQVSNWFGNKRIRYKKSLIKRGKNLMKRTNQNAETPSSGTNVVYGVFSSEQGHSPKQMNSYLTDIDPMFYQQMDY